ncbi:MAG TPA: PAS domain S-box protein [Bacteroidetes bacterium]|nr:PAS domain S-box protein [Bacteroidota bacterium]
MRSYLNNILTSMDAGVICCDVEGRITVFNRAAEKLTGYSAKDVIGSKYDEIFAGTMPSRFSPVELLRKRQKVAHHEKHILRADGSLLPVKFSVNLLQDDSGEPIGVVEVFEDLSEIRRWERELQHARTLMALGEMAGQVAHEIRNPLGAIAGFAALLDRDTPEGDPRKRLVRKIIEGVGNMDRIIGNLVFLARPVKPNLKPVNLKWLLNDVVDHILFEFRDSGKVLRFKKKFPRQNVQLMADPHLIQQMFLHLLRNAAEAVTDDGEIEIQLQRKVAGGVRISIRDHGKGMPVDVQDRLFQPFATSKHRGTGLGLPIVRKIVELHQGTIDIKSRLGWGTRVTLEFPDST